MQKIILVSNRLVLNTCRKLYPREYVPKYLRNVRKFHSGADEVDSMLQDPQFSNYIKKLKQEYDDIYSSGKNSYTENARASELGTIMRVLHQHQNISEYISSLNELLKSKDTEMIKLATKEKAQYENQLSEVKTTLLDMLANYEGSEGSFASIILEVQAGVGGQEAMLFAKELFDMYCRFCENKEWNYEIAELADSDQGGVRHASMLINDLAAFNYLKNEAGVHRVQRIPTTEKAGRVHTSTASVIVLPEPNEIEVRIEDKDLRIETKRAQGAGGQHVNKTESAVRITHTPTNTVVECQIDRSQIKNRKFAMARLRAILYEKKRVQQRAQIEATRKTQVKTRDRNEKIRTYNFSQDRITDHRLQGQNLHNLDVFMQGGEELGKLMEQLNRQLKIDILLDVLRQNK